jgi:hypothetical protein
MLCMDPYGKNYVEIGKFPYGLCLIQVRYGWCSSGSPKISFFRYFLKIFWPFHNNNKQLIILAALNVVDRTNKLVTAPRPYGLGFD